MQRIKKRRTHDVVPHNNPGDYKGPPIRINLTKSSSTSVGAGEVERGREGLYGRPRPVPCAHLWGNALPPPPPGDHKGPPSLSSPPSPLRIHSPAWMETLYPLTA